MTSPLACEITRLRTRLAIVEQRNRELEALLAGAGRTYPRAWKLTRVQARILDCLMAGGLTAKERLDEYVSGGCPADGALKRFDVHICYLRRKLAPHGFSITTVWGQGYLIDPDTKQRLRAAMRAAEEE